MRRSDRKPGGFNHHRHHPVSLPYAFLRDVVPAITDAEELQTCLAFFRLLADASGDETPIAERSVLADRPLRDALRHAGSPRSSDDRIFNGLELAVGRGTLLRFIARSARDEAAWYYLNTPVNRQIVEAMEKGLLPPPSVLWTGNEQPAVSVDPSNAFRLYEQNIGPLTPIIADRITQATADYPADWIEDAIEEAVTYNKRSWRYILTILENWAASGRRDATEPSRRF